jgi:1-acyl-sn-glycerol-3-phosphate acyltransferase
VRPFYTFVVVLSWPVVGLLYRLRVRGREHLPEGGFVLASNHLSNFDPWPLATSLFPKRELRFMAKSELFENALLGALLKGVGAFRVQRGQADTEAMRTSLAILRDGGVLAMFPQGTRSKKGRRRKLAPKPHPGAARIALQAGVPIIPVAIKGTDRLLALGPFRVTFGPAIPMNDLRGSGRKDAAEVVTQRLFEAIARLESSP